MGDERPLNDGRRERRDLLLLWLGSWLLFVCVAHGNLESTDTSITLQAARALWVRGDSGLLRTADGAEWLAEGQLADHIVAMAPNGYGMTGRDGRHQYVWFPLGHQLLLVPPVAIGEQLGAMFPEVERRFAAIAGPLYREGQFVFDQAMIALLLPSAQGATTLLLLWLIARRLGAGRRDAGIVAFATMFGTQCFVTAHETLSNGPGLTFLLGALYAAVCCHVGTARARTMVLGGLAGGAAVLCRYQQALMLLPIATAIAIAAWRRRRWSSLLLFVVGGAPMAVLLLVVNQLRFGDPTTTGYPPLSGWSFNYPVWLGVPRMLLAAGKGILWLSPLLWWVLPLAARRRAAPQLRWLAWALFLAPVLIFSGLNGGWQSGQCWSSRYVTDAIVVLSAIALAQARPWQRRPRSFAALCAVGVLVNVTSLMATARCHDQMATQGTLAWYEEQLAQGKIGADDLRAVRADPADRFYMLPRFSPLHANWTLAGLAWRGELEDESGRPRNGAEHTIEPLFGVTSANPAYGLAPIHWEDRNLRQFWSKFWGDLLGVPWWALLLPPAVAAIALLRAAWRRLSRD